MLPSESEASAVRLIGGRRRDVVPVGGDVMLTVGQCIAGRIGLYPAHRLVDPDVAVVDVLQPDEHVVIRRVAPLAHDARLDVARRGRLRMERDVALRSIRVVVLPEAGGVNSQITSAPHQSTKRPRRSDRIRVPQFWMSRLFADSHDCKAAMDALIWTF